MHCEIKYCQILPVIRSRDGFENRNEGGLKRIEFDGRNIAEMIELQSWFCRHEAVQFPPDP